MIPEKPNKAVNTIIAEAVVDTRCQLVQGKGRTDQFSPVADTDDVGMKEDIQPHQD